MQTLEEAEEAANEYDGESYIMLKKNKAMPNLARNGRRGGIKNKALGNYPGAFNMLICGGVTTFEGLTAPPPKLLRY